MAESAWLASCSSMLKDKSKLGGVSWRQFLIDTCNVIEAVDAEGLSVEVKFSVCYISTLIIAHCDEEDARFPATFLLVEKVSDVIIRHLAHSNTEVKELFCHCLTLLLNLHSFPKFSKHCCTDAVVELFDVCRQILSEKLPNEGSSFVDIIKSNEKAVVRSSFLVSNLEDYLLKDAKSEDNSQEMKRLVLSCLFGRSVQGYLSNLICMLPTLSEFSSITGDKNSFVKKEWSALLPELKLLTAFVNPPLLGRKGCLQISLLSLLTDIPVETHRHIIRQFLAVLDICLAICRIPSNEAPNFCFALSHAYSQSIRSCMSSWVNVLSKVLSSLPAVVAKEAIYTSVTKISSFFSEALQKGDVASRHSLFYVLLLDFAKLLDISVEYLSSQNANSREAQDWQEIVDSVAGGMSLTSSIFQSIIANSNNFVQDSSVQQSEESDNEGVANPRNSKDLGMSDFDASYIDEDGGPMDRDHDLSARGSVGKRPSKSSSQDDPCTAIFNLFALDDQLTVPSDIKVAVKSSSMSLSGLLNALRSTKSIPLEFWQWSTECQERPLAVPVRFIRYVSLSLGASIASTLRKMNKETRDSFAKTWSISEFASMIVSLRKVYERPVTRQRASLLNVVEYLFVSLVQQSIINTENCKEIFISGSTVGASDFWLANVDAFVRRIVFVFAFHLSSAVSTAMTSFVQGLWSSYLATISHLTIQNFNQNAPVLSVSLANDMLFYFYLLPFTEKRTLIARICSTLTQIVAASVSFDYPQFALLLAFADLLVCRFVYEPPENSLKERIICGPVDDTCNAVLMSPYNCEASFKISACYETLCLEHQIKPPPVLDRLGLASFCACGGQNYNDFYTTLMQLTDPDRFGRGIGVESLAIKTSAVWNTWLGLWYLLPVLPPPLTMIEQLIAIDKLKSASRSSLTSYVLLFSSMATLFLKEHSSYNPWMEDAYLKLNLPSSSPSKQQPTTDSTAWLTLRTAFSLENLLEVTSAYMTALALEFKQTYLPFAIDSKIPDSLPSLPQLTAIQLLVCNISQLVTSSTKDFGESAANEMVKSQAFGAFMTSALELFEWMLYFVKFAASRALYSDEVNDRCLHLRAFLETYGAPGGNNSSPTPIKPYVFDQLVSKAAARSGTASSTGLTRPPGNVYMPLMSSVELKPYILNPYFRHLYCVVEMFYELFTSTASLNNWKSAIQANTGPITADTLNPGTEPTFVSAVYEAQPYLQNGNGAGAECSTFKVISQLLAETFGDAWSVASGEYLLAISHRLLFAISENSGVGTAVSVQKSFALKQAALKCITNFLPTTKPFASIWQRTYAHSSVDSCNLGRVLLSCNEAALQPQAVNVVCQILLASAKPEFEQELTGVVSTLNSLANETSVMFLLMSLLSSTNGSRSSLEELLSSLVAASSVMGPQLFNSILDCLLKVCSEALKAGDFGAVSEHIFPAIIMTTRALADGEGHVKTLSLMRNFLATCRKVLTDSEGKEDPPLATIATLLAYTYKVIASASKAMPSLVPRPTSESPAMDELLGSLFSPLGNSSSTDGRKAPSSSLGSNLQTSHDSGECDDAEEDEDIDSKMCTFTQSQKSFMNQHWYHCHTCSMTDGFGVCSVCAKVCHKDHDLAYSKFSSFFCDCGAKEDNSCIAKMRRISGTSQQSSTNTTPQQQQAQEAAAPSSQQPTIAARFGRLGVLARGRPLPPTPTSGGQSQQNQAVDLSQQQQPQPPGSSSSSSQSRLTQPAATSSPCSLLNDSFAISKESAVQRIVSVIRENELNEEVCLIMSTLCGFLKSESMCLAKRCQSELERLATSSLSVQIGSSLFGEQCHIDLTSDFKFDSHKVFESDKTRLKQLVESGKVRLRLVGCNPTGSLGYYAVIQARNRLDLFGLAHLAQAAASVGSKAVTKPRKYQPHKLGCLTLPFSLAGVEINRENDALLAVYGSSDVEVVLLSASSYVPREQLAIQIQMESQQSYIVGCRWLPGSQSVLGVVINDCVKIFDTAADLTAPLYHFLLPSCKIVDLAFAVYSKDEQYALILGSNGHIYVQKLCPDFAAHAGPFYVTSIVLARAEQKSLPSAWRNAAETLGDGGLSLSYSHRLQVLVLTCESGVYLLPHFVPKMDVPSDVFVDHVICVSPRNDREKWVFNGGDIVELLVPGLFLGITDTGNVVALSIRPDGVSVAISEQLNHCGVRCCHFFIAPQGSSNSLGTSRQMCVFGISNDGKLLKYSLEQSQIGHWMSYSSPLVPEISALLDFSESETKQQNEQQQSQPQVRRVTSSKEPPPPIAKRSSTGGGGSGSGGRSSYAAAASSAVVKFPVDFFEHCQPATNVEFGGSQLLYIYNREQLKTRLAPTNSSLYIAAAGAFSLSVTNRTVGTLLVGIRFQLGNHRPDKVPQFIRIFERTVPINCPQPRWFDCPLTRAETIAARNKLQIYFGASSSGTTIVDSLQPYVKSREEFGWVEPEVDAPPPLAPIFLSSAGNGNNANKPADESVNSRDRLYPPIYVTSSAQLVLLSCIGILRRLGGALPDEKIVIQLLQTPSTLTVLRATLSWLLSSSNNNISVVRNIVRKAVSNIDLSKRDVSHFELALLLNSFLALTSNQDPNNSSDQKCSPELLKQLVEQYHELSVERPFTWSTTPIYQLQFSRSLTFAPYLVLLLLEALTRPQSAKMLASLLGSPHIDESFIAQQALDLFYFSGPSSPWAAVMNNCNGNNTPISPTTSVEKFHTE